MLVNINSQELKEILDFTPSEQNIMLVGRHGIGKSEILTKYFESKGMRVVTMFLGQMSDPGDLIGLPSKENGKTDFIPPYWFPTDGNPVVLFLDELNRARPEVLQTIMDLALNRKLAGKSLPQGSRIISAINSGEEYQLTDLDPALVSRFNVYNFKPTANEWLLWAEKNGIDDRITSFLQSEPVWLDGNEGQKVGVDTGLDKSPDRRAWKKVSDVIKPFDELGEAHRKVVGGIIGMGATSRFFGSITGNKVLTGLEILTDFKKHEKTIKKYKLHQVAIANESVFRYLESTEISDKERKTVADNLKAYYKLLNDMGSKENLANFASIFEKNAYPKAILFILDNANDIFEEMMEFIQNI